MLIRVSGKPCTVVVVKRQPPATIPQRNGKDWLPLFLGLRPAHLKFTVAKFTHGH